MLQDHIKRSYDKVMMSQECEQQIKHAILMKKDYRSKTKKIYQYIPKPAMACALAVCLLLVGEGTVYAATGSSMLGRFLSFAGNAVFTKDVEEDGTENSTATYDTSDAVAPAEYADGKLVFTANGEKIDITDQVSETQAYMYTYVDVEEVTHYLIVGGTPEEFGYAEFMKDATGTWVGGYFQGGVVGGDITPVWLENAKEQLDIPW